VWYLIAAVASDVRVYRVARLAEVRVLDEPVVLPPGFDLAAYWQQASLAFKANIPQSRRHSPISTTLNDCALAAQIDRVRLAVASWS
jgi:predicted DNA-binding transcriptional regulator YafY